MPTFRITNPVYGNRLGDYVAKAAEAAGLAMLADDGETFDAWGEVEGYGDWRVQLVRA